MIRIAIISNPERFASRLTRFFTKSDAYHIGFVDTLGGKFYDQHLIFRRRRHPHYPEHTIKLYQCPVPLTAADLEHDLDTSEDWYGFLDYSWFAVRKFLPWLKNSPSFKGAICSEKVEQILINRGWRSPFGQVPSPADFEQILEPV